MDTYVPTLGEAALRRQVELLAARDWQVAGAAWKVLGSAGPAGIAAVIEGLSHPWARVRRVCADFIDHGVTSWDRCPTDGMERLREMAAEDPVPYVRRAALHALGCVRCKVEPLKSDPVALLIEHALTNSSMRVRREALGSLWLQPPDPRAAIALRTLMEQETDPKLLQRAHEARKKHDPEYRQATIEAARVRSHATSKAVESATDTVSRETIPTAP